MLGLTFKEDVNDIRNSKVPDIIARAARVRHRAADPRSAAPTPADAAHEYGLELSDLSELRALDALVLAVSHKPYLEMGEAALIALVRDGGVVIDVKSVLSPACVTRGISYYSL